MTYIFQDLIAKLGIKVYPSEEGKEKRLEHPIVDPFWRAFSNRTYLEGFCSVVVDLVVITRSVATK